MLVPFGRTELDALVASEGGPHVSIYMPTHTAAIDTEHDIRRLKNLIQDAEKQLAEGWVRRGEVQDLLAPLSALIHDQAFWSQRQNGLAIFLSENHFKVHRLSEAFEERLSISRNYLIRPIIPLLHKHTHGFLLALSEHKVALYEIGDQLIRPVSVPGLPVTMEKTLNYTAVDRGQQSHSGAATRKGKRAEVFHGHGGKPDSRIDDLRHFFRAIDESVCAQLGDAQAPLILACVDSSVAIYEEVNSYSGLRHQHVSGNVDYLDLKKLLTKSLPILQDEQTRHREKLALQIREHLDTVRASEKANEVICGAFQGRVGTLFFDEQATVEGQFDPILQSAVVYKDTPKVEISPYNTDLVEIAVQQTLRHKGDVYSVSKAEMPGHGPLAALFRY